MKRGGIPDACPLKRASSHPIFSHFISSHLPGRLNVFRAVPFDITLYTESPLCSTQRQDTIFVCSPRKRYTSKVTVPHPTRCESIISFVLAKRSGCLLWLVLGETVSDQIKRMEDTNSADRFSDLITSAHLLWCTASIQRNWVTYTYLPSKAMTVTTQHTCQRHNTHPNNPDLERPPLLESHHHRNQEYEYDHTLKHKHTASDSDYIHTHHQHNPGQEVHMNTYRHIQGSEGDRYSTPPMQGQHLEERPTRHVTYDLSSMPSSQPHGAQEGRGGADAGWYSGNASGDMSGRGDQYPHANQYHQHQRKQQQYNYNSPPPMPMLPNGMMAGGTPDINYTSMLAEQLFGLGANGMMGPMETMGHPTMGAPTMNMMTPPPPPVPPIVDYPTMTMMTGANLEMMPQASPHYPGEGGVGYPNSMPLCRTPGYLPIPGGYGYPKHPTFVKPG